MKSVRITVWIMTRNMSHGRIILSSSHDRYLHVAVHVLHVLKTGCMVGSVSFSFVAPVPVGVFVRLLAVFKRFFN